MQNSRKERRPDPKPVAFRWVTGRKVLYRDFKLKFDVEPAYATDQVRKAMIHAWDNYKRSAKYTHRNKKQHKQEKDQTASPSTLPNPLPRRKYRNHQNTTFRSHDEREERTEKKPKKDRMTTHQIHPLRLLYGSVFQQQTSPIRRIHLSPHLLTKVQAPLPTPFPLIPPTCISHLSTIPRSCHKRSKWIFPPSLRHTYSTLLVSAPDSGPTVRNAENEKKKQPPFPETGGIFLFFLCGVSAEVCFVFF